MRAFSTADRFRVSWRFGFVTCTLATACAASPVAGEATETDAEATASSTSDSPATSAGSTSGPPPMTTSSSSSSSSSTTPSSSTGSSDAGESSTGSSEPGPDLREPGPHPFTTDSASFVTAGCTMGYDITAPSDTTDAPTVILAHGFQGNRASMADWAAHYASWGLAVVTPDLCHATVIDADHAQNGADLVALAEHLALAMPIYAGYSAGGLAAVVAAAQDRNAIALVGLDMVDSGGLGSDVAAGITIPAHDVIAEPAMCNSTANGVPVFAAMADSSTLRITEADHCDFQSPKDAFCSLCSAPNPDHTDEDIAATIRGLTTAALVWRSGIDESGAQWWTAGGFWFDMLVTEGTMSEL